MHRLNVSFLYYGLSKSGLVRVAIGEMEFAPDRLSRINVSASNCVYMKLWTPHQLHPTIVRIQGADELYIGQTMNTRQRERNARPMERDYQHHFTIVRDVGEFDRDAVETSMIMVEMLYFTG